MGIQMAGRMILLVFMLSAAAAVDCLAKEEQMNSKPGKVNYGRPFEPPTRPAFIPLPPGAVEPAGWLRDWCITARDGYTGHMDEFNQAFRQAWASDYKMTGDRLYWPNADEPQPNRFRSCIVA